MSRQEAESSAGKSAIVNGRGDLMMVREKGRFIGRLILIKRCTKGGMVICVGDDGSEVILPPRNLDLVN
jgi:hypothetical protein